MPISMTSGRSGCHVTLVRRGNAGQLFERETARRITWHRSQRPARHSRPPDGMTCNQGDAPPPAHLRRPPLRAAQSGGREPRTTAHGHAATSHFRGPLRMASRTGGRRQASRHLDMANASVRHRWQSKARRTLRPRLTTKEISMPATLAAKSCTPCRGSVPQLTIEEAQAPPGAGAGREIFDEGQKIRAHLSVQELS